jgi:hypothetical protein
VYQLKDQCVHFVITCWLYIMHQHQSMLKKKSNSIAYHAVRENVAMGELLIGYNKSEENIADVMTKVLPNGSKRDSLIQAMMWDIC